jgi:hypothetical protein
MIENNNCKVSENAPENMKYLDLQKKARASFKKLLKLNGKLNY